MGRVCGLGRVLWGVLWAKRETALIRAAGEGACALPVGYFGGGVFDGGVRPRGVCLVAPGGCRGGGCPIAPGMEGVGGEHAGLISSRGRLTHFRGWVWLEHPYDRFKAL